MIEIVHYMNRYGRKMTAVFPGLDGLSWLAKAPPQAATYMHRYHAGLEEPHHPLPAPLNYSHAFDVRFALAVMASFFEDDDPGEPPHPVFDDEHPTTCRCEICRYWGA